MHYAGHRVSSMACSAARSVVHRAFALHLHNPRKGHKDMALQYGVLRARFDRAKREDGLSTPHLQIRALDATGQPWRVAVNVQSQDHSEVVFWIVDPG